jgi:hypothetical protein
MPKYLLEREMPGVGALTAPDLQNASKQACCTIQEMGPQIQWVQSFVTGDKVYCLYIAPDASTIHEHARLSGFPANAVAPVEAIIDPTTAE